MVAKPRIVAIDDESEFIEMLQSYFIPRGYDINVALRGAKGIELIANLKPDVVLTDLKMPGIDGDEVLSLVKSITPAPKIIFISAYDDGGKTKARLLKMGAHAFIDKPISSLRDLEELIKKTTGS